MKNNHKITFKQTKPLFLWIQSLCREIKIEFQLYKCHPRLCLKLKKRLCHASVKIKPLRSSTSWDLPEIVILSRFLWFMNAVFPLDL